MLVVALHLISQPEVFVTSWIEFVSLLGLVSLLGGLATAYHHIECNQEGCHRLGRFRHGHLKLCHVHHPHVPEDGKINQKHIDAVTQHKV